MKHWNTLAEIRREYGDLRLDEQSIDACPILQFQKWFSEVVQSELADPTAMVLSSIDHEGRPDSRVVLLKGIEDNHFVFYTNYLSVKAKQLAQHPAVALNFFWPTMARQVRIRGYAKKVTEAQSDAYFASRPHHSKISATVSLQSEVIASREALERAFNDLLQAQQETIVRPQHWGGYAITPDTIEFWQGRDNRLHDRIQYVQQKEGWVYRRLAP